MLADWLSDAGRKAIEKASLAGQGEVDYMIESYALDNDHGRVLAPLRDRAREWLEENTDGWSGGLSSGGYSIETYDADSNAWTLHSTPQSDWDGCLILAILGTENA